MARCETFDTDDPWEFFELTDPLTYSYTYTNTIVYQGTEKMTETYTRTASQGGRWSGLSESAKDALVAWVKANYMRSMVEATYDYVKVSQTNSFTNGLPSIDVTNEGSWFTVSVSFDETDSYTTYMLATSGSPVNPISQADIKSHIVSAAPFTSTKPSFRTYLYGEHEDVEEDS